MATYAVLDSNNVVIDVVKIADSDQMVGDTESESLGQTFCAQIFPHYANSNVTYKKTSMNTRENQYLNRDGTLGDQSKKLRGNAAQIGGTYDPVNDQFRPKKEYASYTWNVENAKWTAPIAIPTVLDDGQDPVVWAWDISWDEDLYQSDNTKGWIARKFNPKDLELQNRDQWFDWNGSSWVERT